MFRVLSDGMFPSRRQKATADGHGFRWHKTKSKNDLNHVLFYFVHSFLFQLVYRIHFSEFVSFSMVEKKVKKGKCDSFNFHAFHVLSRSLTILCVCVCECMLKAMSFIFSSLSMFVSVLENQFNFEYDLPWKHKWVPKWVTATGKARKKQHCRIQKLSTSIQWQLSVVGCRWIWFGKFY